MLLVFPKLRIEGQGENLGSSALAFREVSGTVAEVEESLLLMEAKRVINLGADAVGGEVCAEFVSARSAEDVLMEDVLGAGMGVGKHEAVGDSGGALRRGRGGDARCK